MEYMPLVESMNRVGGAPLGKRHTVLLFDNIRSAGAVQYAFQLVVYDNKTQDPVYIVSSEVNQMAATLGGGSHFLCVFDGSGHANMGDSDNWCDPRKFFPKAIQIVEKQFGLRVEGLEGLTKKWWQFWK